MRADPRLHFANSIFAALPHREAARLLAGCTTFELNYGKVLFEPGERLRYVYFQTTGLVSLLAPISDGFSAEVGIVGSEGMAGASMILGVPLSPVQGLVQGLG